MPSGVFLSTRLAFQPNTRYTLVKSYKTSDREGGLATYFLCVMRAVPPAIKILRPL